MNNKTQKGKFLFLLSTIFFISCRATYEVSQMRPIPEFALNLIGSLRLENPVVAIALDYDGKLLLLESQGTVIKKISEDLCLTDSLILPTRILYPKGITADQFFFYIYTQNQKLFRYDRKRLSLSEIVLTPPERKIEGLVIVNPQEIYLADGYNNSVIMIDGTGKIKDFLLKKEFWTPKGLAYDNKRSELWLLNPKNNSIEAYTRTGNLKKSVGIQQTVFEKILFDSDGLYLLEKNRLRVFKITPSGIQIYKEGIEPGIPLDFAVKNQKVFVLETNRLLLFQIE